MLYNIDGNSKNTPHKKGKILQANVEGCLVSPLAVFSDNKLRDNRLCKDMLGKARRCFKR